MFLYIIFCILLVRFLEEYGLKIFWKIVGFGIHNKFGFIKSTEAPREIREERNLVTVPQYSPILLPEDLHQWDDISKARLITLYAVDTMFRTVTPLLGLFLSDQQKVIHQTNPNVIERVEKIE